MQHILCNIPINLIRLCFCYFKHNKSLMKWDKINSNFPVCHNSKPIEAGGDVACSCCGHDRRDIRTWSPWARIWKGKRAPKISTTCSYPVTFLNKSYLHIDVTVNESVGSKIPEKIPPFILILCNWKPPFLSLWGGTVMSNILHMRAKNSWHSEELLRYGQVESIMNYV